MQPKLPTDIKWQALWIVRGSRAARQRYLQKREAIIREQRYCTGSVYDKQIVGEQGRAQYPRLHSEEEITARVQEKLAALEWSPDAKRLAAVQRARAQIGADVIDENMRNHLQRAIIDNCEDGRGCPFEKLGLDGFSRRDFYRRRDNFLYDVAQFAGIL